jgi:hypothetical protein
MPLMSSGGMYQPMLPLPGGQNFTVLPGGGAPTGTGGIYQPQMPGIPDRPPQPSGGGGGGGGASASASGGGGYGYMPIPPPMNFPIPQAPSMPPIPQVIQSTQVMNMPAPPQIITMPVGGGTNISIPESGVNVLGKSDLKYNAIKESSYK